MSNLLAARSQMAMSLGFHIIFAVAGMAMPLLMVISEWKWQKTNDPIYLELSQRWAKGTAVLFAVGAVSGTVLSFELGLLWPKFMQHAGPVIGMPFSLEGFAFFLEAIFLGVYLYGRKKVSPKMHFFSGIMVAISGAASGLFVMTVNAWMNCPTGFEIKNGQFVNINVWKAMFNPASLSMCLHMLLAAYLTCSFAVASIHAFMLLKNKQDRFHQKALSIAILVGGITALLQPLSGDLSAKYVAKYQPAKLAAMEGLWETKKGAGLKIGGWPSEKDEKTYGAVEIPYLLSILAFSDPKATVKGLKEFPKDQRPPVAIVHVAFQIMVFIGLYLILLGLLAAFFRWKKKPLWDASWYLKALIIAGPLGFIALEAGWVVTEVGRQPWIIYRHMRTAQAVTPMPGIVYTFTFFSLVYLGLSIIVFFLLKRIVFQSQQPLQKPKQTGGTSDG